MRDRLANFPIVLKFSVLGLAFLVLILLGLTLYVMRISSQSLQEQGLGILTSGVDSIAKFTEGTDRSFKAAAADVVDAFFSRLPQSFSIDVDNRIQVGARRAPALKADDVVLTGNNDLIDAFVAKSKITVGISVREGEDFIRVATSIRKPDGSRAVGIPLPHDDTYRHLINNEEFAAVHRRFDRYLSGAFRLMRDRSGAVIGVTGAGMDVTGEIKALQSATVGTRLGDKGRYFILSAEPGDFFGKVLAHPDASRVGVSHPDLGDPGDASSLAAQMIERKQGVIRYRDAVSRNEKVLAFSSYAPWHWIICGEVDLAEFSAPSRRLAWHLVVAAVISGLILAGLLYFAASRVVSRRLERAVEVAQRVSKGDLTMTISDDAGDEIGRLMSALAEMKDGLAKIADSVKGRTQAMIAASRAIAVGSLDFASRTNQQAASVEEISATMDTVTQGARHTADRAYGAKDLADQAGRSTREYAELIAHIQRTMEELLASSSQIAEISAMIDAIAFQTNILSLNAAVEAARAGSHGKGFAVVAAEVRHLAQRSADSAKRIKGLVADATAIIGRGAELSANASAAMSRTVQAVQEVSSQFAEIATAAKEQSERISDVRSAIQQVSLITEKNAELARQTTERTQSLEKHAADLGDSAQRWKTERTATVEEAVSVAPPPKLPQRLRLGGAREVASHRR